MRRWKNLVLVSLLCVDVAFSHHSLGALFDTSRTISVAGEVTEVQFIAPHSYIHLRVIGESAEETVWQIESYPQGMLIRKGLTQATLQPGDEVAVRGYPSRDGRPLMRLLDITMPDGQELQIH